MTALEKSPTNQNKNKQNTEIEIRDRELELKRLFKNNSFDISRYREFFYTSYAGFFFYVWSFSYTSCPGFFPLLFYI